MPLVQMFLEVDHEGFMRGHQGEIEVPASPTGGLPDVVRWRGRHYRLQDKNRLHYVEATYHHAASEAMLGVREALDNLAAAASAPIERTEVVLVAPPPPRAMTPYDELSPGAQAFEDMAQAIDAAASGPLCGKYVGDNDGTCPQLTCIRTRNHTGDCDNTDGRDDA